MSWPLSQDYNEAIQDPAANFSDPELRRGEAACNALGMPLPRSGNFADVYALTCSASNTKWAVKCFTRHVPGLRERYSKISSALQASRLPFAVDFNYIEQGIRVRGQWYPILKMRWVEGLLLNDFVRDNLDKPAVLGQLSLIWGRMAKRLRDARIAHCDLQHGNVLLVPGSKNASLAVKLIDYDGMFVPALARTKTGEVGHPNYQHPQRLREGVYNAEVDRFSLLVVATALQALAVTGRSLWERYDNGDNLLFKESDLQCSGQSPLSPLFCELLKIPDPGTRTLIGALLRACRGKLAETPLLTDVTAETKVGSSATITVPEILSIASMDQGRGAATNEWESLATSSSSTRVRRQKSRGSKLTWILLAGSITTLVLASLVVFRMLGGKEKEAPIGPSLAQQNLKPQDTEKDPDLPGTKQPGIDSATPPEKEPKLNKEQRPKPDPKKDGKTDDQAKPNFDDQAVSSWDNGGEVTSVAFSRDGKRIVSGGGGFDLGEIKVWDAATGKVLFELKGHKDLVNSVAFSPDGKWIVSGSRDQTVKVWDAEKGSEIRTLQGHKGDVTSVAFSPNSKQIVSGSRDHTLIVWVVENGKEWLSLNKHTGIVWSVACSPDGKRIVSGSFDRFVKVWDADKGTELVSLKAHDGLVNSVAFSPDSKRIVSSSFDKLVKVWDAATGLPMLTLTGHTDLIDCVAFSPDGKRIVSGSRDHTVKVWDADKGMELLTLKGHTGEVCCVALSADGKWIVSGSKDHTVKVWDADKGLKALSLKTAP